ncbi:MAG TPA: histidinol-phosphate transaminase [Candidatus Saccharimonadales bacterium]|nr:histidinol-phosphate transaminase [Candidatus Saccharimonadales bacterium]
MKVNLPVRQAILDRKTYEVPSESRLGKLRLDFNENTTGCSPAVKRALAKISSKQLGMYPEYEVANKKLARFFKVRPEELLLQNGGDEGLRLFFDVFVEQGSSILICEPTFPMYRYYAEIFGAKVEVCNHDEEMRFPLDEVLAALGSKPRVLFIANPNNPTGTVVSRGDIKKILEAATDTAVVIDEAYWEFCGTTVLDWINQYPNLYIVRTFSKAAALAGLRLGAVIACPDSLSYIRRAGSPFPVNTLALVAAEAAIGDPAVMKRYVSQTKKVRNWFAKEASKLGVKVFPSGGNFILADFGEPGPALFSRMRSEGILLRERSQQIAPGFARITIGTQAEMKRLLAYVKNHFKAPGATNRNGRR